MYIEWKFNDDVVGVPLEEFERDYESFFGFMMLKLEDYQLGYINKRFQMDEGNENISYYIISLIKCGITLLLGQDYKVQLNTSNLLEIRVKYYRNVSISVVHTEKDEIICSHDISFRELTDEINNNFKKYIESIRVMNSVLLESRTVSLAKKYYDIFSRMLVIDEG